MSASLVGSEMCIRDRVCSGRARGKHRRCRPPPPPASRRQRAPCGRGAAPVSYTHLTLPTICSV
eukprot:8725154-Alexandrium_andersonii.AAC.1